MIVAGPLTDLLSGLEYLHPVTQNMIYIWYHVADGLTILWCWLWKNHLVQMLHIIKEISYHVLEYDIFIDTERHELYISHYAIVCLINRIHESYGYTYRTYNELYSIHILVSNFQLQNSCIHKWVLCIGHIIKSGVDFFDMHTLCRSKFSRTSPQPRVSRNMITGLPWYYKRNITICRASERHLWNECQFHGINMSHWVNLSSTW